MNLEFSEPEVRRVLSNVAGRSVTHFDVESHPTSGGVTGAELRKCCFSYTLDNGRTSQTTLIVKRCVWKGRAESVHYQFLARAGVPLPRFYGSYIDDDGRELVFLEWLRDVGLREKTMAVRLKMFSLLARINACPIDPDYEIHLHEFEQGGDALGGLWITGLSARPDEDETERDLRSAGVDETDLPLLLDAASRLFETVTRQPSALLHQDFFPDNVGWRGDEMLVFDLHKMSRGPRFADLAGYLGEPDWSDDAPFLNEQGRRRSLVTHYLSELARFGGPTIPADVCESEMSQLAWAHKVAILGWLVEHEHARKVREVLEFLRRPGNSSIFSSGLA